MKLRTILTVCATALAALAIGGAGPASAATTCTGTGSATLTMKNVTEPGLGLVGLYTARDAEFFIEVECAEGYTLTADGDLSGTCGLSTGSGRLNGDDTKQFNLQTGASGLVLSPKDGSNVNGAGNAVADPTVDSNSCAAGTAKVFQVTGVVSY